MDFFTGGSAIMDYEHSLARSYNLKLKLLSYGFFKHTFHKTEELWCGSRVTY